jgi:flagellar biogenesis protein FliO
MKALLLLCVPSLALAAPSIETIDRGDVVEVIAHDITAANTNIIPVRSRLEVPLATKIAPIKAPSADPTVVITEADKQLSIKLPFDRAEVKALAPFAKAVQIDNDLHVLIPRKLPAAGFVMPEPTVAKAKAIETPPLAPPVEVVKPAPAPVAAAPAPQPEPAPQPQAAPPPPKPVATAKAPNPLVKPSTLGVLALVALGCGMWIVRRRKKAQSTEATIDVIAQRQLGAKAKIVWLAAGSREMIVSVTPQAVRILSQWKKDGPQANAELPPAHVVVPRATTQQSVVDRTSPAVSGLLKLRAKTVPPPDMPALSDEIASGDTEADAAWAKEILLATRAARGTR